MSTQDGNLANANTFNTSYVSREEDSDTVGVLGLNNTTDPNSGTQIVNTQRLINEVADSDGTAGEGDATRKDYATNNVVADGDNRKVAIEKIDATFDGATGHNHDGTAGNGPQLSAANLGDFNNFFAEYQELTFDAANGNSTDVSTDFAAKTPGGTSSSAGVITSAPDNRVEVVGKDDFREVEDPSGNRVYGRITESSGTWTLTYYVNIAGVETAHSLSSQNIRYLYREVFTAATRPTLTPATGNYDSLAAVEDIPDASNTVPGKVSIAAQNFGGVKNFIDGLQRNGVDVATISDAQTITNKILEGGTATSTRYWQAPSATTAVLQALPRVAGAIYFSTDELTYYGDDGTALIGLGGGGGGGGLDSSFIEDHEELEASDYTTGNSSVFADSGVATALPADEEVTQLAGTRSMKYTQVAGSLNDWGFPKVFPVSRKDRGKFLALNFYGSYSGNTGEFAIVIRDTTNSNDLETIFINTSEIKRYSTTFFCPSNTTELKIGYQVKVENIGSIAEWDNFEVSADPFVGIQEFGEFDYGAVIDGTTNTGSGQAMVILNESDAGLVTGTHGPGTGEWNIDFSALGLVERPTINANGNFSAATNEAAILAVRSITTTTAQIIMFRETGARINDQFAFTIKRNGVDAAAARQKSVVIKNSSASESQVIVNTGNGWGSTNTKIRRFANIESEIGDAITYADSATDGGSFTINARGVYHVSLTDSDSDTSYIGLSLNSTQLTSNINNINVNDKLGSDNVGGTNQSGSTSVTRVFDKGDVIRAHGQNNAAGTNTDVKMSVVKIGSTQLTGVPLPRTMYVTYELANGTNGGNGTIGSYGAIAYNTLSGDIFGSLAGGVLTLPGGKYIFEGEQEFFRGDRCKFRVQDTTNAATAAYGKSVFADNAANRSSAQGRCDGVYEITDTANFQFEQRVSANGLAGLTLGVAASFGEVEEFGRVKVTKVE